jgi:hypothetical protein
MKVEAKAEAKAGPRAEAEPVPEGLEKAGNAGLRYVFSA